MSTGGLARGARGGGVLMAGQFAKIALQMAGVVVLSRLLSPADFGLVAMVMVFLALADLLRDFGMPTAALQARSLSHQQASNVFWVNTSLGAIAAGLIIAATPLLVAFYGEARLSQIAPVMAFTVLLNGIQAQLQVQLARAARFLSLAVTDIIAQATGLALAILATVAGWGYWALVVQLVSAALTLLILRGIAAGWLPARPRRGHGSAQLLRAGGDFGLAQLLSFAANNVDNMAIGATWGTSGLGFYNRAFQIYVLPRTGLLDPLTQVVVPTMNDAISIGRRTSEILLRVQFTLGAAVVWAYLILATTAEWLVPLVLGDQWGRSAGIVTLLAIGGCFTAFGSVSYWVFVLEKKSRQLLYLHLVTKPTTVAFVIFAVPFGVEAVAFACSLALALSWPINLIWLAKCAGQDSWAFFRVGVRLLSAAGVSYFVARWLLGQLVDTPPWLVVVIGVIVASATFITGLAIVPGGRRHIGSSVQMASIIMGRGSTT